MSNYRNLGVALAAALLLGACQMTVETTVEGDRVARSVEQTSPNPVAPEPAKSALAGDSAPPPQPGKPGASAQASDAAATMLAPMVERRETLTGTGYAVISVQNHRTPAQQRLLAIRASKLDAYRSLAEQVYGQYLDSSTTIADAIVLSDNFRARVEGVIYNAVVVSISPVGDDTYETTLSLERTIVEDLRKLYLAMLAQRSMARRVN